jgi:hypothetical protein
MTDQQISDRGLSASQVLENPAYIEAMEALKASIVNKWKECSLRDKEGQTLTLQMMRLADTFEGLLSGYVEAGKLAHRKLDIDRARDESTARKIMRRVL